ncbi:MAG: signal recognition particle-docking protein FtsY [Pseudomonadota bacterium]
MSNDTKRGGFFGRMLGKKADDDAPPPQADAAPAVDAASLDPEVTDAAAAPSDATPEVDAAPAKTSWYQRLTGGLSKTSGQLSSGITSLFSKKKLDAATLDDLEDILIQADLGVETASRISDAIASGRYDKGITPDEVRRVLADEVARVLEPVAVPLTIDDAQTPHVILVVGVNGAGKTTTIGKLASRFKAEGRAVHIAAGDTFRAAAIEQLAVWGARVGAPVTQRDIGADPAGLAFDALTAAREANADVLLIDTAGRLQNKQALMDELDKIVRVIRKIDPAAPHSVLLVLDATTGQNAMNQVEVFGDRAGVTGLIMTKLDGTARGGILVAIAAKHQIPVHAVGVGEGVDDLQPFTPADFAEALAAP